MENENEQLQDEEIAELPQVEEGQEDTTDWKAEALKYQGIAKRLKTKAEKAKDTAPDTKGINKSKKEADSLDYGQLAFYNSKSDAVKIESDEDIEYLQKTIAETGRKQSDILGAKWFQAELKERAELRATKEATPSHDKRATTSGKDTVEYWLAKGGLPEDQALKIKVVNARIAKEKSANNAPTSSVISNLPSF
jgi:hypothetical protein